MEGHRHDLINEFPEYKEKIHTLKTSNAHFRKLAEKYEILDKSIAKSEGRVDLMSEQDEESLRKERLKIKEELYSMLKAK